MVKGMVKGLVPFLACFLIAALACDDGDYVTSLEERSLEPAAPAVGPGRPLEAVLDGPSEVPPGDPDGSGTAIVRLNQGLGMVCWELTWENILEPFAAHIHVAPAGVAGPIVVPFDPIASGCTTGVDPDLIKAIRQDPAAYYVNIHNAEFPPGAIRGQLSK